MNRARRQLLSLLTRRASAAWLAGSGALNGLGGIGLASEATAAAPLLSACGHAPPAGLAQGIAWQLDNAHIAPDGRWDALGVTDLLVQWSAVDDIAFVDGTALQRAPQIPAWHEIANRPWAQRVVMGLAGRFDEARARQDVPALVAQSRQLVAAIRARSALAASMPLNIEGWYFPVEVDPSWTAAPMLHGALAALPRPLWISVYDRTNVGGATLAKWLASWLPEDVGVFFQDGVGVYARDARVARSYADALAGHLGTQRVRVIAEAFRPLPTVSVVVSESPSASASASASGSSRQTSATVPAFRAATAAELAPQLRAYQGYRVYLFDGPHYVSNQLVEQLLR